MARRIRSLDEVLHLGHFPIERLKNEDPKEIEKLLHGRTDSLVEHCVVFGQLQAKLGRWFRLEGSFKEDFCLHFGIDHSQFRTLSLDDVETILIQGIRPESLTRCLEILSLWKKCTNQHRNGDNKQFRIYQGIRLRNFPAELLMQYSWSDIQKIIRPYTDNLVEFCVVSSHLLAKVNHRFQAGESLKESFCGYFGITESEYDLLSLNDIETISAEGLEHSLMAHLDFIKRWKKTTKRYEDQQDEIGLHLGRFPVDRLRSENPESIKKLLCDHTSDLLEYCLVYSHLQMKLGNYFQYFQTGKNFKDSFIKYFGIDETQYKTLSLGDIETISAQGFQYNLREHVDFVDDWRNGTDPYRPLGSEEPSDDTSVETVFYDAEQFEVDNEGDVAKAQVGIEPTSDSQGRTKSSEKTFQAFKLGVQQSMKHSPFSAASVFPPSRLIGRAGDSVYSNSKRLNGGVMKNSLTITPLKRSGENISLSGHDSGNGKKIFVPYGTAPTFAPLVAMCESRYDEYYSSTRTQRPEIRKQIASHFDFERSNEDLSQRRVYETFDRIRRIKNGLPPRSRTRKLDSSTFANGHSTAPQRVKIEVSPSPVQKRTKNLTPMKRPAENVAKVSPPSGQKSESTMDKLQSTFRSSFWWLGTKKDTDTHQNGSSPSPCRTVSMNPQDDKMHDSGDAKNTSTAEDDDDSTESAASSDHADSPFDPPKHSKRRPKEKDRFEPDLHGTAWGGDFVSARKRARTTPTLQRTKPKHALLSNNVTNPANRGRTLGVYPKDSEWKVTRQGSLYIVKVISEKILPGNRIEVKWLGYKAKERVLLSSLQVPTDNDFETFEQNYQAASEY